MPFRGRKTSIGVAAEKRSGLPRYLVIANELRSRILRGDWEIGDRVPTNKELALQFSVTAVTAREAVKFLESRGLLKCRRGSGTFVAENLPRIQSIPLSSDFRAVIAEIGDGAIKPLPVPVDDIAPWLPEQSQRAEKYVRLVRLAFGDDRPLLVADVWLDARLYEQSPDEYESRPVLPKLIREYGDDLQRSNYSITIEPASEVVADALCLMPWSLVACMHLALRDPKGIHIYSGTLRFAAEAVRLEIDI